MHTLAEDVAFVVGQDLVPDDEHVYLASVPDGLPLSLNGSAAIVFLAVVEGLDPVLVASEASGTPVDEVSAGVEALLTQLVQRGILVRTPEKEHIP